MKHPDSESSRRSSHIQAGGRLVFGEESRKVKNSFDRSRRAAKAIGARQIGQIDSDRKTRHIAKEQVAGPRTLEGKAFFLRILLILGRLGICRFANPGRVNRPIGKPRRPDRGTILGDALPFV
jgi:hypothetical protein